MALFIGKGIIAFTFNRGEKFCVKNFSFHQKFLSVVLIQFMTLGFSLLFAHFMLEAESFLRTSDRFMGMWKKGGNNESKEIFYVIQFYVCKGSDLFLLVDENFSVICSLFDNQTMSKKKDPSPKQNCNVIACHLRNAISSICPEGSLQHFHYLWLSLHRSYLRNYLLFY